MLSILEEIEGILEERPVDRVIVNALINDLKRKLSEYILIDEMMKRKYGMSFEEFKKSNIVRERKYSFEVESDYCDWELAIDGIETIREKIRKT